MTSLLEITGWLALAAGAAYWFGAMRSKELARAAGLHACRAAEVQFLDDTVALTRVRLRRDDHGRIRFFREYRFEFTSDGNTRYHGELAMLGTRVVRVELEPYRDPGALH